MAERHDPRFEAGESPFKKGDYVRFRNDAPDIIFTPGGLKRGEIYKVAAVIVRGDGTYGVNLTTLDGAEVKPTDISTKTLEKVQPN